MRRLSCVFLFGILILAMSFSLPAFAQEKKSRNRRPPRRRRPGRLSRRGRSRGNLYDQARRHALDISGRFLKDPYQWPKLWERNPYITNPHWIYPGKPVRLRRWKRQPQGRGSTAGKETTRVVE